MLKIYKHKGVTLIELMVAVGLGLILILSMLAFYSISSKNVLDFQKANHDQQQIRKMMNLLETDIENIGGFECEDGHNKVFSDSYKLKSGEKRFPQAIISLGNVLERQQIIFVHPIIDEYRHTAFGMLTFDKDSKLASYTPTFIENISCGSALSSIYVGSTVLEMIPMNNIITIDDKYAGTANNIRAFVALSSIQSRRDNGANVEITDKYTPTLNDATVMFLSDENNSPLLSVGKNTVNIFLGFSPTGKNQAHVPDISMSDTTKGGWINPFESEQNYNLLVDDTKSSTLFNEKIHTDGGTQISTSPLKADLIHRVRAIKFQFTFGAHGDIPERKLTRVIRFKNTHLMSFDPS